MSLKYSPIRWDRVREMAVWLESISPLRPFGEHPDFDRFADFSRDEFAAVGEEMKRRAALDLAFTELIEGPVTMH